MALRVEVSALLFVPKKNASKVSAAPDAASSAMPKSPLADVDESVARFTVVDVLRKFPRTMASAAVMVTMPGPARK